MMNTSGRDASPLSTSHAARAADLDPLAHGGIGCRVPRRHTVNDLDQPSTDYEIYLVSSCILGIPTRRDGGHSLAPRLVRLAAEA